MNTALFRCAVVMSSVTAATVVADPVDFARDVAPIFEQHCVPCHSSLSSKGDLSLETFRDLQANEYVVAGDPDASHLIDVITAEAGQSPRMPQKQTPLSAEQVRVLRRWISAGAVWPDDVVIREQSKADASWWSLQPLDDTNSATGIDDFIHPRLAQDGLQVSPEADRRTLIRRLLFDLTGLPPTPEQVRAFTGDADPQAYEHLVDQLLSSPHFGERWARHWLDIAHYADTHGFERDKRRDNAWPYRDYVIRAFNDDKPYDQFLREQIAGDVMAPGDPEAVIATGFLAAGPWDYVGHVETKSPELRRSARALDLDDMVTQTLSATLALTVNCARCHDHKLDPILQREYYQLTAVFAGLQRGERDVIAAARDKYETRKRTLNSQIAQIIASIAKREGNAVDLADIVGGGNGFGSGTKKSGLDVRSGRPEDGSLGALSNVKPGVYQTSERPFIDGVFVPAAERTVISSSGLVAGGLPENSGQAWDVIRNGPVTSQYSTTFGETDFSTAGHSMIGLHANSGITFDLHGIRKALSDADIALSFSTVAGYGGRLESPSAEYRILLDGVVQAQRKIGRLDADSIAFDIPPDVRFLTFVATDGGDGYGHDQISFGDPRLNVLPTEQRTPEDEQQLARLRVEQVERQQELKLLALPPRMFGVVAQTPPAVQILVRGNPETPADGVVSPGALGFKQGDAVFGDANMPEGQRRLALADWITEENSVLTARVIVNRLWHWHFGQGLVRTPSDFGYGGGRPSHPKLLDWLAAELIRSHWSLKHIHRLIVTSGTYRQSSRSALHQNVDSDNRLLWRMNGRRLEAEAVRDAVLAVAGTLNQTMYGPGYRDFDYEEAYAPIYTYQTADSSELWRRSVYRFIVRTTPQQFLATLDCADPANLTPARNVTTTPLQSLALFNNDFMLRQSQYFARRLEQNAGNVDEQIDLAFRLAFGRPVTPDESAVVRPLVRDQGLVHFCRVLFNANEFVYVDCANRRRPEQHCQTS